MARIESQESQESCEPPLRPLSRSSLFFIGTDSRGNWVVRDQAGLCGGFFINHSEALRFAMLENGRRPWAVIMVPGILEFSIGGRTKQSPRIRRALSKPRRSQRPSSGLTVSSQVNHQSEASWSPHTADHNPSPDAEWRQNLSSQYRFRASDPVVHDSMAANVAADHPPFLNRMRHRSGVRFLG